MEEKKNKKPERKSCVIIAAAITVALLRPYEYNNYPNHMHCVKSDIIK